ncbi:Cullin-2 [Orchesella cincta]|uniref:Cullin-2 n=1 Tax=Orchesella cincta TaxID=48709 RepID=A0A1D2MQD4_ORCCI|nr:Cullin-2 [Orchesella cincta]
MSLRPKQVNFDETWGTLRRTIEGVVTLSKVPRVEWNDRFTDVYTLCVAHPEPYTNQLYNETQVFLRKHVQALRTEIEKYESNSSLLKVYYDMWIKYSQGVEYLNKLYSYLNQQHVKKSKLSEADITYGGVTDMPGHMIEIGELGLEIWRQDMLEKIQDTLIELVLEAIRSDRRGDTAVSTTIVNGVVHSFVAVEDPKHRIPGDPHTHLTFYEKAFEAPFLQDTGRYYQQEASKLITTCSVSEYMEKVIQKLNEEDMRARRYLHASSYGKLSSECHRRLVSDHLSALHSECRIMVENDRRQDLTNTYGLLKPLASGLNVLADTLEAHIKKEGLEAVSSLKQETAHMDFVESIILLYKKYKDIVNTVFKSDQMFISSLDKACTAVINFRQCTKNPCRSPELLAKYCDALLKKSTKGYSETEVDEKLSQSIIIFRYIDDKDVFQKFYSRNLARRLINHLSHSMDAEEGMINRLKQACGYEFTNKLHRMFTDVSVSSDLNNKFNDYLTKEGIKLPISFSIMVLQAGAWPLQQNPSPFAIPQILESSVQKFETFYGRQFNGRKLTWLHHLSSCDVKLSYTKKPYFIIMQTFQIAVLTSFETQDEMVYRDIREATRLTDDQFSRHLQSLIECKLLECDDKEFTQDSIIKLNKGYSNKRAKFRISGAVQKETPQEVEQTHVSVEEDRKIFIQAAIVRIMKSRKVIKHNVLIQEVLQLSNGRFSPTISVIKKCIETLIERAYLERTPNSADEYSYVA